MSNSTSIIDNYSGQKLGDFLKQHIEPGSKLSFVTAYFTIYAYEKLKHHLNEVESMRLLFGEPRFIKKVTGENVLRGYKLEDEKVQLDINRQLEQRAIAKECAEWIEKKVEVRSMVQPDFLHGKFYHIEKPYERKEGVIGSSNFTVNGLGLGGKPNIELNQVINHRLELNDLKDWFDSVWNNELKYEGHMLRIEVEDVKEKVLEYLKSFYEDASPELVYYKTLYHLFDKLLQDQKADDIINKKTGFYETEIWEMLYPFQKDGVKGAINKIENFNGCVLADSVGLGKTFEALAVIQYFLLKNKNVLVLCPKKLGENWKMFQPTQGNQLNPFKKDKFGYHLLYHSDVGRTKGFSTANNQDLSSFNWGAYDLVVIDESHNFRNNPIERTTIGKEGAVETKKNRSLWLMDEIIKSGVKTKVLLLSATPVNNTLRDLRNQVYLITERNSEAFASEGISHIGDTLKNAQKQFTQWADKKNENRTQKGLLERLDSSFFKLMDTITIARSRKHILSYYNDQQVTKFPERLRPTSVYTPIDLKELFFTYDELNKKIMQYKLSIFNPSKYVKEGMEHKYGIKTKAEKEAEKKAREEKKKKKKDNNQTPSTENQFDQADREHFLIGMMKVNFLKRLESSVESFQISMENTIAKIDRLIERIQQFKVAKKMAEDQYDLNEQQPNETEKGEDNDEFSDWVTGKKLLFKLNDLNVDYWLADLKADEKALNEIFVQAKDIDESRDAKLKRLRELISEKVKSPINGTNKKVVVFTAFADTAQYLFDSLITFATTELSLNIALVSGSKTATTFGDNNFNHILTNFSPRSKSREKLTRMNQEGEIDILIATDCISEGQNLQDCDYLINYDIHWNPVRIIQRFGRIDRLGSINEKIQLVNFWPTEDLDNYINLKQRVEARMALVDVTATAEDNLLSNEQLEELITDDLKYRHQQLKRLKDEVLDIEEMSESISLTDFTLDDFRSDLLNFIENNRDRLENAPTGLNAVVPALSGPHAHLADINLFTEAQREIIKPGVIFCLRQNNLDEEATQVNPLSPYFLAYIRYDGEVRYNYTHARHVLDMFRQLCLGKSEPYEQLCKLFNTETNDGRDMGQYSGLLAKASKEITRLFKQKNLGGLTSSRQFTLVNEQSEMKDETRFELITWLVIK